jgi:hypothetical protein
MENKDYSYSCYIPEDMVKMPHMIHVNGCLAQPGTLNDYIIKTEGYRGMVLLCLYEVSIKLGEILVSVTNIQTGERWAQLILEETGYK